MCCSHLWALPKELWTLHRPPLSVKWAMQSTSFGPYFFHLFFWREIAYLDIEKKLSKPSMKAFTSPPFSDCWRSTPCGQHMVISNTVMRQVKRLILRQGLKDFQDLCSWRVYRMNKRTCIRTTEQVHLEKKGKNGSFFTFYIFFRLTSLSCWAKLR